MNYLKTRKQFGVPIGKFQALKHQMADMLIAAEQARSMAIIAAVHADSEDAASAIAPYPAAKAYIGQAGGWSASMRCNCMAPWAWSMNSSSATISND